MHSIKHNQDIDTTVGYMIFQIRLWYGQAIHIPRFYDFEVSKQ